MCGRAVLSTPPDDLAELFGLEPPRVTWPVRYNIAPTELVAVIRSEVAEKGPRRFLELMRWGLLPSRPSSAGKLASRPAGPIINVRVESVQKGAFAHALQARRCLLVFDGFYEWSHDGRSKTPHFVQRSDQRPMTLAGLWQSWTDDQGEIHEAATILTVPSAPPVSTIHDRMPLIVSSEHLGIWLDPSRTSLESLAEVLGARELDLVSYVVDPRVNSPKNDGPENIVPFERQRTLFG
jgi:putative SOS response-associated peptidase YedK